MSALTVNFVCAFVRKHSFETTKNEKTNSERKPKFYPEKSDFSNVKAIFNIYISMYENLFAPKPMAPKQSFNISKHSM